MQWGETLPKKAIRAVTPAPTTMYHPGPRAKPLRSRLQQELSMERGKEQGEPRAWHSSQPRSSPPSPLIGEGGEERGPQGPQGGPNSPSLLS